MRILIRLLIAGLFVLAGLAPALAAGGEDAVVVADVRGPLEQRALDFLTNVIENEPGQLIIIQVNNPGVASGNPAALFEAIRSSDRPVTVWVGPSGAQAFGGAAHLLEVVAYSGAASGAEVGIMDPTVVGRPDLQVASETPALVVDYQDSAVVVSEPIPGLVDEVVPTIGQFIASLNGRLLATASGPVTLETTEPSTADDGTEIVVASVDVRFLKPGLLTRFLRLAIRPEAMVFFLTIGLAAAAFEFYAAGVGITAGVAVLTLFLAGFGIASLPMNWLSFALILLGMGLYTADFQNATISWRGVVGTVFLLGGGLTITSAAPQFGPRWWAVVLTVIGIASFYIVALTTVARSRFSTRTIGREHLVGRHGIAETSFDPMGIVEVDGARWQARSHRAAGVGPGDAIEVVAVSGIMLEIALVDSEPESIRE